MYVLGNNMTDLEKEFQDSLEAIEEGKANFPEDEQNIIDSWIQKLSEPADTDEAKTIRNNYARTLAKMTNEEKQLAPPFSENPSEGDLPPLPEPEKKKFNLQYRRMPCVRTTVVQGTGAIPKTRKPGRPPQTFDQDLHNEFEDPEEMAKAIARSKGLTFAEFLVSISRHTADYGQGLRAAMNAETTNFREYVDHVLSQRIKDLTEVLDEEQNQELLKIKKDVERWQLELSLVKRRIKEIVPGFDVDLYKKDKNYLKKLFTIDSTTHGTPQDDSFQQWKEETCHRLKWMSEMTNQTAKCNEEIQQQIANVKSATMELEAKAAVKQQSHVKYINCEMNDYQKLKLERDKLLKETNEIMSRIQELGV